MTQTHSFWLNLMMAAIFNSAILNLAILDSAILVFPLKLTHIVEIGSHHLHKKTSLIHSDSTWRWQPSWTLPCWIQTHGILDSDTLLSSLRFTQKHSHTNLTLTQTNSIWSTWWWEPSWNLPFWILPSWIQPFCTKKDFTNSFSINLMMAAILNCANLDSAS